MRLCGFIYFLSLSIFQDSFKGFKNFKLLLLPQLQREGIPIKCKCIVIIILLISDSLLPAQSKKIKWIFQLIRYGYFCNIMSYRDSKK